jgi:hypothetical protein
MLQTIRITFKSTSVSRVTRTPSRLRGVSKATSLELLPYQMDVDINARLPCFALRIKIEDEEDRQFNDLTTPFLISDIPQPAE